MSADPIKPSAQRPINLGKAGALPSGQVGKPRMSAGRKSTLAVGLIAAGGISIFAFLPGEQCEADPVTGQQQCSSRSSSSSSSHGGGGSSHSSSSSGSTSSDAGSGTSSVARGGFGSSGGLHFFGGG
ncbi:MULTISPECIES: hypothetical protein [unclassified Beijerinckia]|uniref:hypothetical protein n=1 Tax=unclassified Beijerinckia TaxID=2638183 RepID=UPI00089D444E|nr:MULTISPECIES: hypothetical protein [unclassified Beijerinckia]MDH7799782.1 hypothetical protein [Beijerinckia sp. GAS462]SED37234.1 hypothetical protein SAMN05443249_5200 [Beijerinckia sp. 28-YEA-48]